MLFYNAKTYLMYYTSLVTKNTESVYYTVSTELDTASLHISLFLKYFKINSVTAASCSHLYYLLPKADVSDLLNIYLVATSRHMTWFYLVGTYTC